MAKLAVNWIFTTTLCIVSRFVHFLSATRVIILDVLIGQPMQ